MQKNREDTDVLNVKGFRGTWKTTAQTAAHGWMVKKMFDYGADLQNAYDEGYKKGKADAVRHGRWKKDYLCSTNGGTYSVIRCSECDFQFPMTVTNYCPHCGAIMDKEKRDDED